MKVNIVIMGQSGNGKSTIVNAIMGKYVAPAGKGTTVTTKNQVYSTSYKINQTMYDLNLYDTVGIELSDKTTQDTLSDIERQLKESQKSSSSPDVNIVWFCINHRSSRFQDFEVDLIRELSYNYEIPFVIVMTQCFDNQVGKLEGDIRLELPEVNTFRVLAEDYPLRGGTVINAYGLDDLLKLSILDYNKLKVRVLETKLSDIQKDLHISEWYINKYEKEAKECVEKHVESAKEIGWLPVGCIPFIHGICIKMVAELHQIYGMPSSKSFAEDIFANVVVGLISTLFMSVPILSAGVACAYVSAVGEEYSKTLSNVMQQSRYGELQDQRLMTVRIKRELNQRKGR